MTEQAGGRRGQGAVAGGVAAREKILAAFTEHARMRGIRGVVMGDLARDLGMSKKTLYQHFESKDALVQEIVERWVTRTKAVARSPEAPLHDVHELLRWWTDLWIKEQTDYCGEFWRDLEADHPQAWKTFQGVRAANMSIERRIATMLHPDIHARVAGELYNVILAYFNDPLVCAKFGFSRREAVLAALEIWLRGALRPEPMAIAGLGLEPDPDPDPSANTAGG